MIDEVARTLIEQHIKHSDERMGRIEAMFEGTTRSIRRLHERWDRLLWSVAGSALLIVGVLVLYIWKNGGI